MSIGKLKKTFNILLDIIFPEYCIRCNKYLEYPERVICIECLKNKLPISISSDVIENTINVYYISKYEDFYSIIIESKMQNRKSVLNYYLRYINKRFSNDLKKISDKIDLIIPVPIHKSKQKDRGFNQSEIIALSLFDKYKISTEVCKKIRKTKPQKELNLEERKQNLRKSFIIRNKNLIKNRKILLVDDVFTTGNTIIELSKCLKQNQCNNITAFTLLKV